MRTFLTYIQPGETTDTPTLRLSCGETVHVPDDNELVTFRGIHYRILSRRTVIEDDHYVDGASLIKVQHVFVEIWPTSAKP